MPKFSRKAKRHAIQSTQRTERMLKQAGSRSGPVTVKWLPGFEPVHTKTKFPFAATINGEPVVVWPDWIEHQKSEEDRWLHDR